MVRIVENSLGLPTARVRELARLARPRATPPVELILRPTRATPSHPRGVRWNASSTPEAAVVEIELGLRWRYPFYHRHGAPALRQGYLSWGWIPSLEVCLLGLLAHELRHCWQVVWPDRRWSLEVEGRVKSPFAWAGERDADRWALQVLGRAA